MHCDCIGCIGEVDMTEKQRKDSFVLLEKTLERCRSICSYQRGQDRICEAYDTAVNLANDFYPDMAEYKKKFIDTTL